MDLHKAGSNKSLTYKDQPPGKRYNSDSPSSFGSWASWGIGNTSFKASPNTLCISWIASGVESATSANNYFLKCLSSLLSFSCAIFYLLLHT